MKSFPHLVYGLASLMASFLTANTVQAATLYWDANNTTAGRTDGAGAWLGANQWWTGSANTTWVSGSDAVFGYSTAGGAVTLAGTTTVNSFVFNPFTGTYTLGTTGAGNAITLNNGITSFAGTGVVTIASPLILGAAQTWTNNSTGAITPQSGINNGGFLLTIGGTGNTVMNTTANVISGAGGITKTGPGLLILGGGGTNPTHTYSGTTTINGGTIQVYNMGSTGIPSGNLTINGGVLQDYFGNGGSFTRALGSGAGQVQILGGESGFGGGGGTSSTFNVGGAGATLVWGSAFFNPSSFVLQSASGAMNTNGKMSLTNGIDLNGANRIITSTQVTDGAATSGGTIAGAIVNSTGTASLTKTGVGNLILTNTGNNYNGATNINGGSITLSGSGMITATTALNLAGGTLRLVNTAQVNRFADVAVTVTAGGGISYENTSGANVYTETLGGITVSGGNLNVVLATNQASTGVQRLTFGTSGTTNMTQSGTGTVAFSAGGTGPQAIGNKNMIVVTGAGSTTVGQIVGPWATTGTAAAAQTDYAVYNSNYVVPAAIAATAESAWTTSTDAYTAGLTGLVGTTLTATRNITALKLNSTTSALTSVTFAGAAAADYITVTGSTFANGDVVSFGGTAPGGLATGIPYYVVNSGTNGAGTFTVSATSGGSPIELTSAGTSPNIVAGVTLASTINLGTTGILNPTGAGLTIGKGTGGVVTLPSTTSANLYINTGNAAAIIVGAPIADNGAGVLTLVKTGTSALRLMDVNTYTGDTAINAGTLQIGINGQALANGAKLGSSGTYAGKIFIGSGAILDVQTTADQVLSGIISGDGTIVKRNTGTLTLSGANTYTGKTSITPLTTAGGGTLVVSSFNSVNGGTPLLASSSLGAPTTIANGTIDLGSGSVQSGVVLRYDGTGETTDRILNFPWNNTGVTHTVEASGVSGLLRFTSLFTSNGTAGNLTLGGTGLGQIDGGLPFVTTNITKSGVGTWTLGGVVGSTGKFDISAGTLIATDPRALGAAIGNLATTGPTISGTGTLSLRNDSSVSFGVAGTGYNINNSASGATINVDRVTGTGTNTLTIGNLTTTSTAAVWGLNFTGANGVSLSAGALTTPVSTGGSQVHTITNNIAGGGTLTLASVFNQATTVASPDLAFTGTGTTIVTGNITQTLADMELKKSGAGTLILNGTNTYTGGSTINAGTLMLGNGGTTGSLSTTGLITNNGTLNFNRSDVITQGTAFGSLITGSGKIVQSGSGSTILSGTNSFTGSTDVLAGTLEATAVDALKSTSTINISGGTLLLSGSGNRISDTAGMVVTTNSTSVPALSLSGSVTESVGALTLASAGTSVIDLGAGTAVFTFADSHVPAWSGLMQIWNWSGSLAGGGTDQLFFGSSSAGLTPAQLASITFVDPGGLGSGSYGAQLLSNGELVPVPEPSPLLASGILLGIVGMQRRRRTTAGMTNPKPKQFCLGE